MIHLSLPWCSGERKCPYSSQKHLFERIYDLYLSHLQRTFVFVFAFRPCPPPFFSFLQNPAFELHSEVMFLFQYQNNLKRLRTFKTIESGFFLFNSFSFIFYLLSHFTIRSKNSGDIFKTCVKIVARYTQFIKCISYTPFTCYTTAQQASSFLLSQ